MDSPIMQHFRFAHLPEHLRSVSRPFCELAERMEDTLRDGPEAEMCLRKLLEAKDCAVRAAIEAGEIK